jgi:periplasmic mercuric ion binding protein
LPNPCHHSSFLNLNIMKTLRFLLMATLAIGGSAATAQNKTDSLKVYGNCSMCKDRIEKALKIDGVISADWKIASKMLTITYDSSKISNDGIQMKIAAVGHDTDKYTADDKVYDELPGCCLYDRKKKAESGTTKEHKH